MRLLIPLFFALAEEPASRPALDGDWPTFRGGMDGAAYREGAFGEPKLRWTFEAGLEIESTAAIVAGRAIVGTTEGGVIALDIDAPGPAGKELWRAAPKARVRSSPGVQRGMVYLGDDDGVFRAVDEKTGTQVWSFETGGEVVSSASFHGANVLFGSYDSHLYCLSADAGKLVWKLATSDRVHATPAVIADRTFTAGCDAMLRVVDIAKGEQVSEVDLGSYTIASPFVTPEGLVVGTYGNQVRCVRWKESAIAWTYERTDRAFPFFSSPACAPAAEGRKAIVVIGGRDKLIHAIELESGKPLWTFPTRSRVDASPVIVGKKVIAAGLDGNLYVLDLATGKELWTYKAGSGFIASPAVGRGKLVISTQDGQILCFDLSGSAPPKKAGP